jgi:hypothetical protein
MAIKLILQLILLTSILVCFPNLAAAQETPGPIYTIYGGNNPYDSLALDWTPGSDNVEWDLGQDQIVYRLTSSASLKYNPGGQFHIISQEPINLNEYTWLSFTGRSKQKGLNFSITFLDQSGNEIGEELKFSDYGGNPHSDYWTQYNFPISEFYLPYDNISGIKITQLSNAWYAVIYLDEMYLSGLRGEDINPFLPTPSPTLNPTQIVIEDAYSPDFNPIFIIPFVLLAFAIFFH